MSFSRLWRYAAFCDRTGCLNYLELVVRVDDKPTPAAAARAHLRQQAWTVTSMGRRLGWRTYCPFHKPSA